MHHPLSVLFFLEVIKGDNIGEKFLFNKPVVAIGRSTEANDFVLRSPEVSRNHARIISRNNEFTVENTGGMNPILINGNLLEKGDAITLEHGDRFNVGKDILRFWEASRTPTLFGLLISKDEKVLRQIDCRKDKITLGRQAKHCDVILDNRYVSAEHAAIYLEKGRFWIEERNSTNGIRYNGTRLHAEARQVIKHGDTLDICGFSLEFKQNVRPKINWEAELTREKNRYSFNFFKQFFRLPRFASILF
ncbi:FHA domain-containing protein [Desulfococcaceae bacterium HSG9]|nr:FHA domain-containing protein [Desulfococcaceae bacterium HSG9]